jgi:hypothetical protein
MLHDEIWQKLADRHERLLCIHCMAGRAVERLGRKLSWADLLPCEANLWGFPHSFFNVMYEQEPKRSRGLPPEWEAVLVLALHSRSAAAEAMTNELKSENL